MPGKLLFFQKIVITRLFFICLNKFLKDRNCFSSVLGKKGIKGIPCFLTFVITAAALFWNYSGFKKITEIGFFLVSNRLFYSFMAVIMTSRSVKTAVQAGMKICSAAGADRVSENWWGRHRFSAFFAHRDILYH